MTILLSLLAKTWPYILGVLAIVAGWFTAKSRGKSEAKSEGLQTSLKVERDWNKEQRDAAQKTDVLADNDLRDRAIDRMRREQRK
jgi:hypothetical protein